MTRSTPRSTRPSRSTSCPGNGSSHTAKHTKAWFKAHLRWHPHWTPPHASWLNMIEIWFSTLAKRVIRHGDFPVAKTLLTRSKPSRSCTTKPPKPTGGPTTALPQSGLNLNETTRHRTSHRPKVSRCAAQHGASACSFVPGDLGAGNPLQQRKGRGDDPQ
ncbi:transposase [Trebonia sp.]|uniref:transposase n=1 Tax=Trebonia sp. TaxID=2767075 RepID=UPI003BB16EC9